MPMPPEDRIRELERQAAGVGVQIAYLTEAIHAINAKLDRAEEREERNRASTRLVFIAALMSLVGSMVMFALGLLVR